MRRGYTPSAHCLILTVRFNPGTLETLSLPLNWQIIYITPAHIVKGSPDFYTFSGSFSRILLVISSTLLLLLLRAKRGNLKYSTVPPRLLRHWSASQRQMGRIAEPGPKRKRGISLLAMIEGECLTMTNGGNAHRNDKSWPPKKEVTPG